MNKTAILVDGGFFLKRYKSIKKLSKLDPVKTAKDLITICHKHLEQGKGIKKDLYRVYYYDCMPYGGKQHNPITGKHIDFSKSEIYKFRMAFFEELKKSRKVALRLGELEANNNWIIKPEIFEELLKGEKQINDLKGGDVQLSIKQKMVDTKIGLDIATITLKKQADQIILISGDSDFVPASKLARTEGVDFILDPMWNKIKNHLFEHIDGLQTKIPRPIKSRKSEKKTP